MGHVDSIAVAEGMKYADSWGTYPPPDLGMGLLVSFSLKENHGFVTRRSNRRGIGKPRKEASISTDFNHVHTFL